MSRTFTIAELASDLGCTKRALRFYEEKGLLSPQRKPAGGRGVDRLYTEADREAAKLILQLRAAGIEVNAIRKALKLAGEERIAAIGELLEARATQLETETAAVEEVVAAFESGSLAA